MVLSNTTSEFTLRSRSGANLHVQGEVYANAGATVVVTHSFTTVAQDSSVVCADYNRKEKFAPSLLRKQFILNQALLMTSL